MRLLIVDNFDSFTFNLVHYLEEMVEEVSVQTNIQVDLNQLDNYDAVVLSPGPGLPKSSGRLMEVIAYCDRQNIPILGVCLGMQALAEYHGNELYNQELVKHGIQETILRIGDSILLSDVSESFQVGLYHSWAVHINQPETFQVSAKSRSNVIMAIENLNKVQFGVQFHPESIMTPDGKKILINFVQAIKLNKTMRS